MTDVAHAPSRIAVSSPSKSSTGWLWWSALATMSTLAHTLIDQHIGLWGDSSDEMSALQAANTTAQGAVYGWWLLVIAFGVQGDRWALRSVLAMAFVNAFLFHGLIALFAAPPPTSAFPYQDLAHAASLTTGGTAAVLTRRKLLDAPPGGRRYLFYGAIAVVVLSQALSGLTFARNA